MKIVFMGTPDYATEILKELFTCKEIEVSLLVTQPDKPVGRKQMLTPTHTKKWLLENQKNIPIYQPKTLKTEAAREYISSFKPDFIVVAAYGQILPKEILNIAPCINLHASLLPKYRGASPIQAALLNNEAYAGVTAMFMEEGLDCGDMLGFSYLKLDEDTKVDTLFEKLSFLAAKLSVKVLKNFKNLQALPQDNAQTSYAKKIAKQDGLVDFTTMSAEEIYIKFRAYDPWPGIYLNSGIKLKQVKVHPSKEGFKAGQIQSLEEGIVLTCKQGALNIKEIQPPSKKVMSAAEYIHGKRLEVGTDLV